MAPRHAARRTRRPGRGESHVGAGSADVLRRPRCRWRDRGSGERRGRPRRQAHHPRTLLPVRPLQILDLSHGIDVPSQFDPDRGHLRAALAFLRGFVDELAQPVRRDGYEHVGYVPTQVVCDYFRGVHRFKNSAAQSTESPTRQLSPKAQRTWCCSSPTFVEDANGTRPPLPDRLKFYGPYFPRDPAVLRLVDLLRPGTRPGTRNST